MAYLRILCGILPFVFFFSLFAFYLLVEDMGWLARLLCILCVLGTLGVCLAFQVWFYRIVQSRRREEQRLALAQECVRQQSLLLHHAESGQNGNDPSAASLLSTIFQAYARRLTAAGGGHRLDLRLEAPAPTFLAGVDLCTLFDCLLANASEAVQALPHSMGWIRVTTKKIGPWFTVAIDNNYDAQSLRPRGANYLSGKYGYLGTGIGLSSVQEVVARYGGHLDIRAAHGVFSVSCRLRAASPQPA